MGVFVGPGSAFESFLKNAVSPFSESACVARNFLMEENVDPGRVGRYDPALAAPPNDHAEWNSMHQGYLKDRVFTNGPIEGEESDRNLLPETFWDADFPTVYGESHDHLELVRVVPLASIAYLCARDEDEVLRSFRAHLEGGTAAAIPAEERERRRLQVATLLASLAGKSQDRPTFGAFAHDLEDVVPPDLAAAAPGWPNRLRDRLGLAHLDPGPDGWGRPIEIALFRYRVENVRRMRGHVRRLIGTPTVLDGGLCGAFCPAPKGERHGFVVDLSGIARPIAEIIHPTVPFRVEHLKGVGTIDVSPSASFREARAYHLVGVQNLCGRSGYGVATDGDILV